VEARSNQVIAVVWYSPTRVVRLGFFPGGNFSKARAVNRDGTVIVGESNGGSDGSTVFRWTKSGGMESVVAWVEKAGGTRPASLPKEGMGISADGSRVVGALANGDPFVAAVPLH
jgi:uncharacterized membrane protein